MTLLTQSTAKWTATQEKAIARDFPFAEVELETAEQFVVRTYLQFLWLPESIVPIHLLVPSLHRVQIPHETATHPLHALLEPLLLPLRSVVAKYHTELPQILAQDGGDGGLEESMMWYVLGYEMGEPAEANPNSEDAVLHEEKSRNAWLERLERREVQIQILLYLLKLSLPGPCTPLPQVTVPANSALPKKKKDRAKVVTPSIQERLESFMDKLSTWQLLVNMDDSHKPANKDERDWMQSFCENVVERQFKAALPDLCNLLRRKLFPHSPFSDDDDDGDGDARSSSGSRARPRPNRKFVRSSTSASAKVKPDPKPIQRSSSHTNTADARSRSRSLSVSLAQDASARRSTSASGTASSLKRALSREVSMSRGFKPRVQASQAEGSSTKVPVKVKEVVKKQETHSKGVTLVAATPTKPKIRSNTRLAVQSHSSFGLETLEESEDGGDLEGDELPDTVKDEDEELWLPNSSPDVLLLGTRKRAASGSSSSLGLSDLTEEEGMDTPVKKRLRV